MSYSASSSDARIQEFIRIALQNNEQTDLSSLLEADAQSAMDEIWKLLEMPLLPYATTGVQSSSARNKLRRLSLKIALTFNKLPAALLLKGVTCTDTDNRGAGGFADVFYGMLDGSPVALKRLRVYVMSSESQKTKLKQAFYRETLLWKNLSHKHILPFLGVSEDVFQYTICMVLPWMEKGSIRHYIDLLQGEGKLSGKIFTESVDKWLLEVMFGLVYLHGEGVVHGDLHGGNILIDMDGSVRLTDFGMALISEATSYNYASMHGGGASRWQAPELIDPEEFGLTSTRPTYASDVYSFACTCIELYSGQMPFAELTDRQVALRVLKGVRPPRPTLSDGGTMSDQLWSLTTMCWAEKPSERPLTDKVAELLSNIVSVTAALKRTAGDKKAIPLQSSSATHPSPSKGDSDFTRVGRRYYKYSHP